MPGAWIPEFLAYAKTNGIAVDFVSTHTYGVDGGFLDEHGKSDTKLSPSPDAIIGDVRKVREQIQASAFPNLPLYFTEWSTSYTPRDSVHDSYISAPYILTKLGDAGFVARDELLVPTPISLKSQDLQRLHFRAALDYSIRRAFASLPFPLTSTGTSYRVRPFPATIQIHGSPPSMESLRL